jgi:hypothetical protein
MQYNKSFLHIEPPFGVWNERVVGGNPHFITGAGGFLQNIIYGYAGLQLNSTGILIDPTLLPQVESITLRRVILYQIS